MLTDDAKKAVLDSFLLDYRDPTLYKEEYDDDQERVSITAELVKLLQK